MIGFKVKETKDYTIIEFTTDGPISPREVRDIEPPIVDPKRGVVISGRGPIWFYGYLIHYYHFAKWVATYDPRLGGAVVVMSHDHDRKIREGDVVEVQI